MRVAISLCLLVVWYTTAVAAQDRRPMTTDDGLNMVNLTTATMSPNGEWVLYGTSSLQWDDNKRETTYHLVPASGGESFQYIGKGGGSGFRFSPDGEYLAFTRSVSDTAQVFLMRTAGGEAVQLTKHKSSVGAFRWLPDASGIVYVAPEPRSDDDAKEHKKGADAIFVDEGPNGQREARWTNFWRITLEGRTAERITDEEFRIGDFDIAADGHRIAFTARFENRRNQQNQSEIFVYDVTTGSRTQLTENRSPESRVRWSPDGELLAYDADSDGEWDLRLGKIWVMDVESRDTRIVSGAFDGNIADMAWTPDSRSILFTGLQRTNTNLFRLDVASGELEQLTDVTGTLRAMDFSADRTRVVVSRESISQPPDLFASSVAEWNPVRLTHLNRDIEEQIAFASGEVVQWRSGDGTPIEGILMSPVERPDGPAPFLLHIHGGPAGVFTNSFRSSYHVWAGLGYVQLLPNVRGSSGYDDALLRGNMGDLGGGDYWDLMSGVDWAIAEGHADADQMGLRGWSYGGILGGWTITQTDRFKGASIGAMVSDWTSEYGPGFNHDVRLWYIGGTPWEEPDRWRRMSPLTHVANVTTPTLLMHGMEDRTDTEPQSMMFFTALKDQGKTTRYIRFPRELHGFREPRHQRIRDIEEIRWIQKYVRGIEWTPWERPTEASEDTDVVTDDNVTP